MRTRRKQVSAEDRVHASETICAKLLADARIADAASPLSGGIVAVYLASSCEIDLKDFILAAISRGVTVVSPRWNGETYEMAELKSLCAGDLRTGPMNIAEPAGEAIVEPERVNAWIVPGLAFSGDGRRIGYGGGWYDRLLSKAAPDAVKIGVAYGFQIIDDIPGESHDIAVDAVVTESRGDDLRATARRIPSSRRKRARRKQPK